MSMNLTNEFLTISNKKTLWDIMYQNGFFNNINKNPNDIKIYFETEMNTIENANNNLSVIDKNKQILIKMKTYLDSNKLDKQNEFVTAEQILKNKQDNFNQQLNNKQMEFDNIINKPIPKDIDFSDKNEDNNNSINNLLDEAIKRRENQLNFIVSSNTEINENKKNSLIKIGSLIDQKNIEIIEIKEEQIKEEQINNNKILLEIDKKNDRIIELLIKILEKNDK